MELKGTRDDAWTNITFKASSLCHLGAYFSEPCLGLLTWQLPWSKWVDSLCAVRASVPSPPAGCSLAQHSGPREKLVISQRLECARLASCSDYSSLLPVVCRYCTFAP